MSSAVRNKVAQLVEIDEFQVSLSHRTGLMAEREGLQGFQVNETGGSWDIPTQVRGSLAAEENSAAPNDRGTGRSNAPAAERPAFRVSVMFLKAADNDSP